MKLENLTMATALADQIRKYETAQELLRQISKDDGDRVRLNIDLAERSQRYRQGPLDVVIAIHPNIITPFVQGELTRLKQALRDMGVEIGS